jgi:hypothetical protein
LSVTLALIPVAIAVAGAMTTRKDGGQDPRSSFRFGTRMKDDGLLNAALKRYGCRSVVTDNTIDSTVGETRMVFERDESGVFESLFIGDIPVEHARAFLTELEDEYALLVQQRVYERLLSKAKERGLVVESEEVQEDNSVTITLRV